MGGVCVQEERVFFLAKEKPQGVKDFTWEGFVLKEAHRYSLWSKIESFKKRIMAKNVSLRFENETSVY